MGTPGSLRVGHSRRIWGWALQGEFFQESLSWALQGVSRVRHSRETLGVGHSRETLGVDRVRRRVPGEEKS